MLTNSSRPGDAVNGSANACDSSVSLPSPQFAALCAQLDPPDGLLLGSRDVESRTVRTDQAEAATSAKRRYRVVSLAPLPRLTVASAASAARAAASSGAGTAAVLGWYRRRIGDSLRPDQRPQTAQLSAKEAHIHRRLCDEFKLPDLLLLLVQHARDPTTQALVTDTTVIRLHSGPGTGSSIRSSIECLPLEVLPVCRTHLAQRTGGGGGGDGSCDTVQALRSADRLRCGQLAVELAAAADAGFAESQSALEALAESLARPPRSACGVGSSGGLSGGNGDLDEPMQPDSPVF